eukprot:8403553-Pyramimonas_sp.AAC.1
MGTLPTKKQSSPRAELYALIMLARRTTGHCRVYCDYLRVVQGARRPLRDKRGSSMLDLWVQVHDVLSARGGSIQVLWTKSHSSQAQRQN